MANIPLSAYVKTKDLLFLSGQIGLKDGKLVSEDFKEQTVQAIANVKKILNENSLDEKNVVDVLVFLVNQDDYSVFNEIYSQELTEPYPTRTVVTVKSLPLNAKIELKVVAKF